MTDPAHGSLDLRPARPQWTRRNGGFTLVEVLITAAVTLVAFAGLVTAQMLALRAASSSLERSQATAVAYELVDRMRLNRGENGIADTALGGGYDDRTLCNINARLPQDTRACNINSLSSLTGNDYISVDLRAWWSAINASGLPYWFAGVIRDQATVTVSVQWDDSRAQDAAGTKNSCLGAAMPASMQEVCVMTQL